VRWQDASGFVPKESEKIHMTDRKQLETTTQTHGSNEHGSYCECIWCLEKDTGTAYVAKQEIEQEMMVMLQDLPLPIAITKQGHRSSDEYTWQCMGLSGKAPSFVDANRKALESLIEVFVMARA
jgi:hypothetical protein